jgi:hypothetical protein
LYTLAKFGVDEEYVAKGTPQETRAEEGKGNKRKRIFKPAMIELTM